MEIGSLVEAAKSYIEQRLLQTQKKFDLVYNSTKDQDKRQTLMGSLKDIERDLKKLRAGVFSIDDLKRYKIDVEDLQNNRDDVYRKDDIGEYKILRNIVTIKLNEFCHNVEVNSVWSYLKFFEREYLSLLSEQNLKLDYGHAYQRDQFFNSYNETVMTMNRYGELLEQIEKAGSNKDYKERLLALQQKQYRDIIIKVGKFLASISRFIEDLLESEAHGEKVLLEPDKVIDIPRRCDDRRSDGLRCAFGPGEVYRRVYWTF